MPNVVLGLPDQEQDAIDQLIAEALGSYPIYSSRYLKVQDPTGHIVKFEHNDIQKILAQIEAHILEQGRLLRMVIFNAKGVGVTSYFTGKFFWEIVNNHRRHGYFIDTDIENILRDCKRHYEGLPTEFKPTTRYNPVKNLEFNNPDGKGLDSTIRVSAAGKGDFSNTSLVNYLFLTNVADWPDTTQKNTFNSLLQRVPNDIDTAIVIEGTAKSASGEFYNKFWGAKYKYEIYVNEQEELAFKYTVNNSADDNNDYSAIFIPWFVCDRYAFPVLPDFEATPDENKLIQTYKLTNHQIQWRRWAIENLCNGSEKVFSQTFPSNPYDIQTQSDLQTTYRPVPIYGRDEITEDSTKTITIDGVDFKADPSIIYAHDYVKYVQEIEMGRLRAFDVFRYLILNDLFFIVYFIMGTNEDKGLYNNPFHVGMCREVETGPITDTHDVWFRGAGKSTIITRAETVQYHLKNPEHSTCILAYKKPLAEAFVKSIMEIWEKEIIKKQFPDVVWNNPVVEAPSWSKQNGATLRRMGVRPEATLEASGLVEGMATGKHFNRLLGDDFETEDMKDSVKQLTDAYNKWEMSENLGMPGIVTIRRSIGTFYSHIGPVKKIMDKKDIEGNLMYKTRVKPRTHNGEASGKPVFGSQAELDKLKMNPHFASQQLCNPTPKIDVKLNWDFIDIIKYKDLPKDLIRIMLVDPAGDDDQNITTDGDAWSICIYGIAAPEETDDLNICDIYMLDAYIDVLSESEAVDTISQMYLRGGRIMTLGYEKFSNFTPMVASHVVDLLKGRGRKLTEQSHSLIWLRPAGRNKEAKIANALQWPLNNSKLHICESVPVPYRERIKMEMDQWPLWHDDGIENMAYVYDILKETWIKTMIENQRKPVQTVTDLMNKRAATWELMLN